MGEMKDSFDLEDLLRIALLVLGVFLAPGLPSLGIYFVFLVVLLTVAFARIWKPELKNSIPFLFGEYFASILAVLTTGALYSPFFPYVLAVGYDFLRIKSLVPRLFGFLSVLIVVNYFLYTQSQLRPLLFALNFLLVLLFLASRSQTDDKAVERKAQSLNSENSVIGLLSEFQKKVKSTIDTRDVYKNYLNALKEYGINEFIVYYFSLETFYRATLQNGSLKVEDISKKIDFEPRNPPDILSYDSQTFSEISKLTEVVLYLPEKDFSEIDFLSIRLISELASHRIAELYLSENEKQLISRFAALYDTSQKITGNVEAVEALEIAATAIKQMTGMQKSVIVLAEKPEEVEKFFFDPYKCVVKGRMDEHPEKIWQKGFFKAASECLTNLKAAIGSFENFGITLLCLPIHRKGKTYGVIAGITSLSKAEAKRDLKIMEVIASILALYLTNIELIRNREEKAVAEERDRIAKEMHDNLIQSLFSILLLVEALSKEIRNHPEKTEEILKTVRTRMQQLIKETREMIIELYPRAVSESDLRDSLSRIISSYSNVEFSLDFDPQIKKLSIAKENALLRIIQEAVSNAIKHGKATRITIRLRSSSNHLELTVSDNGTGFEPARIEEFMNSKEHFGLSSIISRATSLGGTARIDTEPGKGTRVFVQIPA